MLSTGIAKKESRVHNMETRQPTWLEHNTYMSFPRQDCKYNPDTERTIHPSTTRQPNQDNLMMNTHQKPRGRVRAYMQWVNNKHGTREITDHNPAE